MPIRPPARMLPANPAAPEPGISFVRGMICGSYPSLLIVTMISALRFARTTQGVTQAVGISSPEISAVAPAGVVAIEMFSVVPRVTDAQPRHGITIAAATSSLIIGSFPHRPKPCSNLRMNARACSRLNWTRLMAFRPVLGFQIGSADAGLRPVIRGHYLSPTVA